PAMPMKCAFEKFICSPNVEFVGWVSDPVRRSSTSVGGSVTHHLCSRAAGYACRLTRPTMPVPFLLPHIHLDRSNALKLKPVACVAFRKHRLHPTPGHPALARP